MNALVLVQGRLANRTMLKMLRTAEKGILLMRHYLSRNSLTLLLPVRDLVGPGGVELGADLGRPAGVGGRAQEDDGRAGQDQDGRRRRRRGGEHFRD